MKKFLAVLLALSTVLLLCACESKPVEINTALFKDMERTEDEFSGTVDYHPKGLQAIDYKIMVKGGFKEVKAYAPMAEKFTATPVIHYEKDADVPYRFDCVLRYGYVKGRSHTAFSFDDLIILTDNHKYSFTDLNETSTLGVITSCTVVSLGEKGIEMIRDIESSSSVKIRMIHWNGETMDVEVDSSVFDSVVAALNLFEEAGCTQLNLNKNASKITVE